MKLRVLIVTDHTTHSETNSMYALARALRSDNRCDTVWVCSRGIPQNESFFRRDSGAVLYGTRVEDDFAFHPTGEIFLRSSREITQSEIDGILVRMPQPVDSQFLKSLEGMVPAARIINSPDGIIETATKMFLLTLPQFCPTPKLIHNVQEALALSHQYEIVLKPLYSYGGRGIVRLSTEWIWKEDLRFPLDQMEEVCSEEDFPMLSMRFLKNVVQGDKRTIVVNRRILGSALRFPAPGSWMCNVAQGGHAFLSAADEEELRMEAVLTPLLYEKGVVMYGFDTLVDDDGRRVLSEINTLSIGGLVPLQELSAKPLVMNAAELILDHLIIA